MKQFCSDVDLLKWEPALFRELALPGQTLCEGTTAVLVGATLTDEAADFDGAGLAAGQVVRLWRADGSIDGCYEIVAVDSATALTVSVVRQDAAEPPKAPPGGEDIAYRVSTFGPQIGEASESLLRYFGIDEDSGDAVTNEGALRQATVFAVLAAVYAGSAGDGRAAADFWSKSLHYQRQYQAARVKIRLGVDVTGDARADRLQWGGAVRLRRL